MVLTRISFVLKQPPARRGRDVLAERLTLADATTQAAVLRQTLRAGSFFKNFNFFAPYILWVCSSQTKLKFLKKLRSEMRVRTILGPLCFQK